MILSLLLRWVRLSMIEAPDVTQPHDLYAEELCADSKG